MSSFTVTMKKERETKRTWRYAETEDAPLIGTLYIPKIVLKTKFDGFPDNIDVTVEAR